MNELPRTPFKNPSNATSICVQLAILGVCFALSYLLGEGRGWAAGMGVGAIAILIELSSPLRKQAWFWSAVVVFVASHVWAVLSLDWSWAGPSDPRRAGKGLIAVFWADLGTMTAIVYGVYRAKYGAPAEACEPSIDDLPTYGRRDLDR